MILATQTRGPEERSRRLREVVDLAVKYHDEAVGCANGGCILAACVMIGAAFEAVLLVMALAFEDELKAKNWWPSSKGDPENWGPADLKDLGLNAGWLPVELSNAGGEQTLTRNTIDEMLQFVIGLRNRAAHPGRYAREPWPEPAPATYKIAYEVVRRAFDVTFDYMTEADLPVL